jgi:predicted nucleic acid-binding protein
VDTDVFSEPVKPRPDPQVVAWLREHESELYLSTITIGEIRRGIERLDNGKRKTELRAWLQSLCDCLKGRVLSFNISTGHIWGQMKAGWDKRGVVVPSLDSQLAATAQRHQLTLVTHNTAHFEKTGVAVLNPFA